MMRGDATCDHRHFDCDIPVEDLDDNVALETSKLTSYLNTVRSAAEAVE